MINLKKSAFKPWRYRPLLVTALIAGNLFQLIAPALADGTLAGTGISNTATGTYADPNDPNTTLSATSNTVKVTVAKVAGITVGKSGITDYNSDGTTLNTAPSGIKVGDIVKYDYTVTNVGNSAINFRIPNAAAVSGPGTVTGNLQISYDGGTTFKDLPSGELITPTPIPIGGSVLVRVAVTVQTGANPGDTISVKLGGTPGDAQNVERTGANSNGGDVFTVDNASILGGAPINNTRTAAATQQAKVGSVTKNIALATILKKLKSVDTSKSTNTFNNNVLTYDLSLRVEQTDVTKSNPALTPANLVGTSINVDGAKDAKGNYLPHILISDTIPANTTFNNAIAPTGWKVVYTTDSTSTLANSAAWSVTPPITITSITRIGFINDTSAGPGVNSVVPGTTLTGFTVQVATSGISTTSPPASVSIANIAQVFGQTAGDTNNTLVYDDSGDQNPDDYHGSTPPTAPGNGIADPTKDPIDTSNSNNATTTIGGADNVYTITPSGATSVLNGPNGAPDATGPSSNNDDFTNKSALIPPNTKPGDSITPGSVAFTNTVKNTGTAAATISLVPSAPTIKTDLPTGTIVTLTYNSLSAAYTYDSSTGAFTIIPKGTPLLISNVASGSTANYGVEVKLPSVPLSTDTGKGYPVPIIAANTTDNDPTHANTTIDRVYTGFLRMVKQSRVLKGTGSDVTADQGDFTKTPGAAFDPIANPMTSYYDTNSSTTPSAAFLSTGGTARTPAPGNILEYRIIYVNVSDKQTGSGDIILNANNVVITEDGNGISPNTNNWALDQDGNGVIDTSNVPGTAKDSGTANITFFSGNPATTSTGDITGITATTDVTKYVDTVTGQVAPGQVRTFGFQRKVN